MNAVNEWSDPDVDCKNDLTPRQLKVLELLAEGHTIKEVARILRLAPATVTNHKDLMMEKLGLKSKVEMTRYAIRHGVVS